MASFLLTQILETNKYISRILYIEPGDVGDSATAVFCHHSADHEQKLQSGQIHRRSLPVRHIRCNRL